MIKNRFFGGWIALFLLCFFQKLAAQQSVYSGAWRQNWQLVNPAAKDRWQFFPHGKHQTWLVSAGSRRQWVGSGFEARSLPTTSVVSVEWEPNKVGNAAAEVSTKLGGLALHDRTDAIRQSTLLFNYNRRLEIGIEQELFLGINGGAVFYGIDRDRLLALDADDATLLTAFENRTHPEVAFGIFYRNERGFYAGASAPQLVSMWLNRPDDRKNQLFNPPGRSPLSHFYAMAGGYLVPTGDEEVLLIEPSAWVRATRGLSYLSFSNTNRFPVSADVNCRAVWQRQFSVGLGYSTMQLVNFDLGWELVIEKGKSVHAENKDRLRMGLNYSFPLGWRAPPLGHSFELTLNYAFWGF